MTSAQYRDALVRLGSNPGRRGMAPWQGGAKFEVEKNSESSEESRDAMRMFCSDPPHDRDDGV